MLNISEHRINDKINLKGYSAFQLLESKTVSKWLINLILVLLVVFILSMFLPWTQNIRSKGYVNSLYPNERPQSIQSVIGGRIEAWYVSEGSLVAIGDTILKLSESKQDYFDPDLLDRTADQVTAKKESSDAYGRKAMNLKDQLTALENSMVVKLDQNRIKIKQVKLKIQSDSIDLVAASIKLDISRNQLDRTQSLFDDGIKSLTDLESKRLSVQNANAKVISLNNKLGGHQNELENLQANIASIQNDYANKMAKSKSDRMTAISSQYDAIASVNKLQSSFNSYEVRSNNYYVLSPINGKITKALKIGIGELVKEGEDIVTIVPTKYTLAVESYIEPRDMPLIDIGEKVRVQFDGWPAIVFSGWPNSSYGTFGGKVYAIDNDISKNGKYRILIAPDEEELAWPEEVRVGGGANSIILLKQVNLGYELWRQLNGFPADYYKESKLEQVKEKAPLKKVK